MSPRSNYLVNKAAIDQAIFRVMDSGSYIMGAECEAFEREFASWLGVDSVIGCANGTDAIILALQGCGVPRGARVATVSHTAVATVAAIELSERRPVLLDVDDTYTVDVEELAALLNGTDPISALVVVHLYGQPANMTAIVNLCERHGVRLIEDCSQAHGAMFGEERVGSLGHASTFSFYPTKNLGAYGDGGAVATNDPACAARMRRLRQYGWDESRESQEPGRNSRLDEIQAAILRAKLPLLDDANAHRRAIAAKYSSMLKGLGLVLPSPVPATTPVFHQYVVRSDARDQLRRDLLSNGIETSIHYPLPVHLQKAYRGRVELGPRRCKTTEIFCQQIVSLPMSAETTDQNVTLVSQAIREFAIAFQ